MILVDRSLGHRRRREGEVVPLDDGAQQAGLSQPHRGGADHRHRTPRPGDPRGRFRRRARRRRVRSGNVVQRRHPFLRRGEGDVLRQVQMYRTQRLGQRNPDRRRHGLADPPRAQREACLGDRPEQRVVVDEHLDPPAELVAVEVAGDRDHRRAVEEGIAHAGGEIGRARPERRDAEARPAGLAAHHVGCEPGRALVRGEHELDSALAHRLDQRQHVSARYAETVADAGFLQGGDDQVGVVHAPDLGRAGVVWQGPHRCKNQGGRDGGATDQDHAGGLLPLAGMAARPPDRRGHRRRDPDGDPPPGEGRDRRGLRGRIRPLRPQPPSDQRHDRVFRAPDVGRARADGVRGDRRVRVPGDDGVQDPPRCGRRGADRERHARPRRALPPGEGTGDEAAQVRADRPAHARQDADRPALRRHGGARRGDRARAGRAGRAARCGCRPDRRGQPARRARGMGMGRAGDEHRSRRGADNSGGPSLLRQLRRPGVAEKRALGAADCLSQRAPRRPCGVRERPPAHRGVGPFPRVAAGDRDGARRNRRQGDRDRERRDRGAADRARRERPSAPTGFAMSIPIAACGTCAARWPMGKSPRSSPGATSTRGARRNRSPEKGKNHGEHQRTQGSRPYRLRRRRPDPGRRHDGLCRAHGRAPRNVYFRHFPIPPIRACSPRSACRPAAIRTRCVPRTG